VFKSNAGKSYPPETIVKDALAALAARKTPSIVSGPLYGFLTFLSTRLMSRKRMVTVMGKNSHGLIKLNEMKELGLSKEQLLTRTEPALVRSSRGNIEL
jgi:hypothetical protein